MPPAAVQPPSLPGINGHAISAPTSRGDINQQGKHIQDLVEQINALPNATARELLQETVQAILNLHGEGLGRILQLVKNTGSVGREVTESLLQDKLVRGLLLIHGLHPVSLEDRLQQALAKVRPYMKTHGGDVELIQLQDDHAKLRLNGHCHECPSSAVTMELAVRQAIEEACPDLLGFELEGVVEQNSTTKHQPAEAPKWTQLDDIEPITEGHFTRHEIAGVAVLIARVEQNLYAYRDYCPACDDALHHGWLEKNIFTCQAGHQFDLRRAGLAADGGEKHLQPFPLLAAGGTIKIAVK